MHPSTLSLYTGAALLMVAMFAAATPQTVGDDACPKYAVDIAAFATCEGDRVVKPLAEPAPQPRVLVDDDGNPLPASAEAIPRDPLAQTHRGHYLTAGDAFAAKHWLGASVLFVDVRDESSVAATGLPRNADFNSPVARLAADGRVQVASGFVAGIKRTLAARGLDHGALIFVICRDGRHAALAAELLAQAGVPHVFVVRGGIEGEQSIDGGKVGWAAARLPMRVGVGTGVGT